MVQDFNHLQYVFWCNTQASYTKLCLFITTFWSHFRWCHRSIVIQVVFWPELPAKGGKIHPVSWFSSLPTSLVFEIFIFWRCCAINLQLIGIKVSQYNRYNCIYIYISLFSYSVFLKGITCFILPPATLQEIATFNTNANKKSLLDQQGHSEFDSRPFRPKGFPRLIFYFHGLSQSNTTKTTRHVRFGVCSNPSNL